MLPCFTNALPFLHSVIALVLDKNEQLALGPFFFHDDFGVIRSKINFFLGARYALWSLRGGMCPFCPPLGPALVLYMFFNF